MVCALCISIFLYLYKSKKNTIQSWISIARIMSNSIHDAIHEINERIWGHNLRYDGLKSSQ